MYSCWLSFQHRCERHSNKMKGDLTVLPVACSRELGICAMQHVRGLRLWLVACKLPQSNSTIYLPGLQAEIGGVKVRVGGIAKGSGMIHPNMATMLCVITSDADASPELWREVVRRGSINSFNQVTYTFCRTCVPVLHDA